MKHIFAVFCLALLLGLTGSGLVYSAVQDKSIILPQPIKSGGIPLVEAMAKRKTAREFSGRGVSEQDLSNLLWAAWGVNRADGKRTIPTSRNRQEAIVFVVLKSGVWRYEAVKNTLILVADVDALFSFGNAPLTLIYAALAGDDSGGMHVGSMYQNVGLYCASAGLANVVKSTGRDALDALSLKLPSGYKAYVVHSIGWPG
ncbi:MAG: nitroreductase family protein [Desulfovibrio sp.]|jgi:hypothetical protein|nr:nitroreductase family protein [Desulfovibrio sp.]